MEYLVAVFTTFRILTTVINILELNMKARIGDSIKISIRGTDGQRRPDSLRVVAIDGNPDDPKTAGYVLEDGSTIGNWEISLDEVLLESEVSN